MLVAVACAQIRVARTKNLADPTTYQPIANFSLLPPREGLFDSSSVIPGPAPVLLSDGRYLFLYNGVQTFSNPGQNTSQPAWEVSPGWAVLDGTNLTEVLFR
eukprot:SAG31_NODE_20746_length_566_cov_0.993576_1_plen_101_part_10